MSPGRQETKQTRGAYATARRQADDITSRPFVISDEYFLFASFFARRKSRCRCLPRVCVFAFYRSPGGAFIRRAAASGGAFTAPWNLAIANSNTNVNDQGNSFTDCFGPARSLFSTPRTALFLAPIFSHPVHFYASHSARLIRPYFFFLIFLFCHARPTRPRFYFTLTSA